MIDASSFKKNIKNEKKDNMFKKIVFNMFIKTLFVVIIFLLALIYIKQSDKNKEYLKKIVYTNNLSFAKIYNVYQKYLGDVVPFKNIFKENKMLVNNELITYKNIEKKDNGYILEVSDNYSVISLKSGFVVNIKNDKEYQKMVTIQNKDGINITYGLLNDTNIKLYDYVSKNEIIANCNKTMYISFEKDGKYLSYEKFLPKN